MKKKFEQVSYNPNAPKWGLGNKVVGLQLLATIKLREKNKKELAAEKQDWQEAKSIYEKYINVGQRFKPIGERANKDVEAKITFIHNEKELVTWKQCNLTPSQIKMGCKPAAGKFSISSMIQMYKTKQITFIHP